MKITVKLFALLDRYLPPGSTGNQAEFEVTEGTTPEEILLDLKLTPEQSHLVLVNGTYLEPSRRGDHVLREGDSLAVWPPVAGG